MNAAAFDEDKSKGMVFATALGFAHYVYIVNVNEAGKCNDIVKVWNDAYSWKMVSGIMP